MESMTGDNFGQSFMLPPPRQPQVNKAFAPQIASSFMDYASASPALRSMFGPPIVAGAFGVAPQSEPPRTEDTKPSVEPAPPADTKKQVELRHVVPEDKGTAQQIVTPQLHDKPPPPQFVMREEKASEPEIAKSTTVREIHQVKPEQRPQPSATTKPTQPDSPKKYDNSFSLNFLASRYGVGAGIRMLTDNLGGSVTVKPTGGGQQSFTYDNSKTSRDSKSEQPQPSAAKDSRPSHPFRLFNQNMPSGDVPLVQSQTQQHVVQSSDLTGSIDTAAEQLLYMLDRIAYRMTAFSQRLAIIESIFDRSE